VHTHTSFFIKFFFVAVENLFLTDAGMVRDFTYTVIHKRIMRTYIHVYLHHIYTHIRIHSRTHTYIFMYIHTFSHIHTYICAYIAGEMEHLVRATQPPWCSRRLLRLVLFVAIYSPCTWAQTVSVHTESLSTTSRLPRLLLVHGYL
jgi:hypothetical protein